MLETYVSFTIDGEPYGKARPQFSTYNGRIRAITPQKTVAYERRVKWAYKKACKNFRFDDGVPLAVTIEAYYGIAKSTSKSRAEKMKAGEIVPTKKPDCDNVAKAVLDALNKIAYKDDAQIAQLTVIKRFSSTPRVEVCLRNLCET